MQPIHTQQYSQRQFECVKMNYTNVNSTLNGTLEMLAGDSANASTFVARGESITTLASAIIADTMNFNSDKGDISTNLAKNLNLTRDEINDFLKKAIIQDTHRIHNTSHPNSTRNNAAACEYYCNGLIKDVFANYRNMHGYISLAVSQTVEMPIQFTYGIHSGFFHHNEAEHGLILINLSKICIFFLCSAHFLLVIVDLHLWNNCQHIEHYCINTKGHE